MDSRRVMGAMATYDWIKFNICERFAEEADVETFRSETRPLL